MKARRVGVLGAVGLALTLSISCGPRLEETQERERVEHRVEPCKTWCESFFDPNCGMANPDPKLAYQNATECIEMCADPEEQGFNWSRSDGIDNCKQEWDALAACIATLTCDDEQAFWNKNATLEYPCKEANSAQALCYSQWAVGLEDEG